LHLQRTNPLSINITVSYPPKANPGVLVEEWLTSEWMANRAMVLLNQGVQHHAVRAVWHWDRNEPVS
jgi:hypothetical protein